MYVDDGRIGHDDGRVREDSSAGTVAARLCAVRGTS
jgi:hypothetical protein